MSPVKNLEHAESWTVTVVPGDGDEPWPQVTAPDGMKLVPDLILVWIQTGRDPVVKGSGKRVRRDESVGSLRVNAPWAVLGDLPDWARTLADEAVSSYGLASLVKPGAGKGDRLARLASYVARNLDQMRSRPAGGRNVTGDAIEQAFTDVQDWISEAADWAALRKRVDEEADLAVERHRVTQPEDFAAYARADGLRAIQSRMAELASDGPHEVVPLPGSVQARNRLRLQDGAVPVETRLYPLTALCSGCQEPAVLSTPDSAWGHSTDAGQER